MVHPWVGSLLISGPGGQWWDGFASSCQGTLHVLMRWTPSSSNELGVSGMSPSYWDTFHVLSALGLEPRTLAAAAQCLTGWATAATLICYRLLADWCNAMILTARTWRFKLWSMVLRGGRNSSTLRKAVPSWAFSLQADSCARSSCNSEWSRPPRLLPLWFEHFYEQTSLHSLAALGACRERLVDRWWSIFHITFVLPGIDGTTWSWKWASVM